MSLLSAFVDKTLSVLRMGKAWFGRLLAGLVEAARTISYVETVNPSQADTLHKEVKWCAEGVLRREFERVVRFALKALRFGRVKVAVDVTEEPYWGKKGACNTRAKVHERSDESWQYVNLAIVEPYFFPLMSLPYRQIDNLDTLCIDLLEYLRTLPLRIDLVLFDRGFYHAHLIDYLENCRRGRPLPYLIFVPKNEAIKEYMNQTEKLGVFKHQINYRKNKTTWKPTTRIVICKDTGKNKKGNPIDWCFATNQKASLNLVYIYKKRWNIETGFRIQDEARIKTKSSNPPIRYFYHLISMLLIITWRIHNQLKTYTIFKRYLKHVELTITQAWEDPPPTSW